jgi:filamentous hemagglutinin family protein
MVTALGSPSTRAQSLGALYAATHQAAAAVAAAAGRPPSPTNPGSATAVAMATANALRYQTQLNSAQNLAQSAQAAARASAAAMNQNAIHGVLDGLGAGGLQPVANPAAASADPTGLNTWQGANLPVASTTSSSQVNVTVTQTQQNAVLSWTTFNVGQHTSLTFKQQQNGVNQPGWVVLNRVVGVLDPRTGLPLAGSVAPSQILGSISAPGTVLVLNQNGILFGATSQVNVGSLVATSLEIGRPYENGATSAPRTIAERNAEFLNFGILGYSESNPTSQLPIYEFSSQIMSENAFGQATYDASGPVQVLAGASLTSAARGYLMLLAPTIVDSGQLTASDGEVALQSGSLIGLTASTGISTSADPDVRGLVVTSSTGNSTTFAQDAVLVDNNAIIQSPRGYVSVGATEIGLVDDAGVITSTTSVSENGYINIFAPTIDIGANAVIAIGPDSGTGTLPQDSTSLSLFKPSRVRIGMYTPGSLASGAYVGPATSPALIDIGASTLASTPGLSTIGALTLSGVNASTVSVNPSGQNALIYAPGGNIAIGADSDAPSLTASTSLVPTSNITVESGSTIDAGGLTNVLIPASRNSLEINPVLGNELADSPAFRNGFLNGATVFLDPRLSGVNANGVAWVGSPLISAAAYAQDVGASVSELMVKGGTVTLGVGSAPAGPTLQTQASTPQINVQAGATIDISGGWKTYQGGVVKQTNLIDANGEVIPISQANPDATYIGVYNGFSVVEPRWGVTTTYGNPLLNGTYTEGQYIEGQDAGALTLNAPIAALNGQLFAGAIAGPAQILAAAPGTAAPTGAGDKRMLQAAPSQLPAGGYLELANGQVDVDIDAGANNDPNAIGLNAGDLSASGLTQVSIQTSGALTVSTGAALSLTPGGVFDASTTRAITVNGSITAQSGSIVLTTTGGLVGSFLSPEPLVVGFADITINGELNVAGRWANDLGAAAGQLVGSAYENGGTITLTPAAQQTLFPTNAGFSAANPVNTDLSGSIVIDPGAVLNLAGGGYVSPTGALTLTAKGGNLNLVAATNYFDLGATVPGSANNPDFAVTYGPEGPQGINPIPGYISARVSIADGSILDAGFGGGGTFALTTPYIKLAPAGGSSVVSAGCGQLGQPLCGAVLPVDFFTKTGFANYQITSNGTEFFQNIFPTSKGAYSAVLATQVVEVQGGQVLDLNQSYFSPLLNAAQLTALQTLTTGSSLYSVLAPTAPTDAWDQKPVNLTLGGLVELRVDAGGEVKGAPGVQLGVSELYNMGTITLHGGTITQSETNYATTTSVGVAALSDVFGTAVNGMYSQTLTNTFLNADPSFDMLTNQEIAGQKTEQGTFISTPIYLLGDLAVGEAVRLATGSVTDLSGIAIVNPRATPTATFNGSSFTDGTVIAGGSFIAEGAVSGFDKGFNALPGSTLDLSGASATFDRLVVNGAPVLGSPNVAYAPTLVWSNGGNLTLVEGGAIAGATIQAEGGAPLALGGALEVLNPVLYQTAAPTAVGFGSSAISAPAVNAAGFSSFIALNSLTSFGGVTLILPRSVFVESSPGSTSANDRNGLTIGSGGDLQINAPYIAFDSVTQSLNGPVSGVIGANTITLQADAIDVTGAVLFDQSIGHATLSASGDIRLIGAPETGTGLTSTTLMGQLAANGDVTLASAQIYPTTGTTFAISTSGVSSPMASKGGLITFSGVGAAPAAPYSAGGTLTVEAANINQDGVVRVPLGALNLGSNLASSFAPATATLTLATGSTTSTSADGLNIPYGTTTDQVEWYFTPTATAALSMPPAGVLNLAGTAISANTGATVDLKGGGDVYAYEFVPGTGGSRDVLNQFNPDPFSSNNGYQYPDGRQVYAIVPGLSSAAIAALDPIYSANYGALYGSSQAGLTVTLNAAPGLAAGTYTLLPAQYALLPGGMRVVQDTGAPTPAVSAAGIARGAVQSDGTIVTAGYFGVAGVDTRSATPVVFDVQSQSVIAKESDIALTEGNRYFTNLATTAGAPVPQLPIDAGRLVITPVTALALGASFETTPADLAATASEAALTGRGSEVDISGTSLIIENPADPVTATMGSIVLSEHDLAALNASSLLLGAIRTDNDTDVPITVSVGANSVQVASGATLLDVTSNKIAIASGVTLSAPEVILAVDGPSSKITVAAGAAITATGAVTGESDGNYVLADGLGSNGRPLAQGGFVRVSDGPQRLLTRSAGAAGGSIIVGAGGGRAATLQGTSVEFDSASALTLASNTHLEATSLALGAGSITVGATGGGLLLTPALQTLLSDTPYVTLTSRRSITFDTGTYAFQTLALNAPGLTDAKSGAVAIDASGDLSLSSSSAASRVCGGSGAFACGTGTLAISANEIAFGSGTVRTYGSGGGVTLTAPKGVFADGVATLNVGAAPLTIDSPFVGDRGTGPATATHLAPVQPALTLTTTGAATFASPTPASAFSAPAGTPGSDLTIDGASVSITGTELRATAGKLTIVSASGISISGGALLAAPSYAKTFGDSADPTTVSAPGGLLSLTANAGDIAVSDDSMLAVGGAQGQAGALSLTAANGAVYAYHGAPSDVVGLAAVLSAQGGGGSLTLDTGGAFDLSAFAAGSGQQFSGAVSVHTATGDLTLAAGDTLTATSVSLTADGGGIAQAGTIDTSGVNGGAVSLYGEDGVHLTSTAVIEAEASGYGLTSTQQATGGNVILSVDGAGALTVDAGAVIDVAAANTGNRLVNMNRTNGTYYTYVAGDVGGTVTFRAPVINPTGTETVDVSVQGAVNGASSIVLDGFERFRLAALANTAGLVGVSISGNTATLDLNAATAPRTANALSGANGPVVRFVQNFNLSSDYAALGGLAALPTFHARPEVELDFLGNIVLASNWNLGAGVVNIAAAVAHHLMAPDPGLPGQYYVVGATAHDLAANEALILADYTTATYRVGGSFLGQPGILTIRAGGNLTLNGSITDGFFQFADQTDPNYLNQVLGGGDRVYQASLAPTTDGSSVTIAFPGPSALNPAAVASYVLPPAPYSAAANSAAALGDQAGMGALVSGTGDPLGSAQLFPLLPTGNAVGSWSYQLVAGAALTPAGARATFQPSADPLATVAGAPGNVVVQGQNVYGYKAVAGMTSFANSLDLVAGSSLLSPNSWLAPYENENGLTDSTSTTITLADLAIRTTIDGLEAQFAAINPGDSLTVARNGNITTDLRTAAAFVQYVSNNFAQAAADYSPPSEAGIATPITYATAPTLVRTGTGSIDIVASGAIDLRNGDQTLNRRTGLATEKPQYLSAGGKLIDAGPNHVHLGGAAVYTAGAIADLGIVTATDVATGAVYSVDLAANDAMTSDNLAAQSRVVSNINGIPVAVIGTYTYGSGSAVNRSGYAGILIADPAYTQGGGDVTLRAGVDVLSTRDTFLESELGAFGSPAATQSWIGVGDQPWRTGMIGGVVNLLTNPQLFAEGVGTLGGGDITIDAGRNVSDISTVASDSITTASVGAPVAGEQQPLALVNLSYGDVTVTAGGNILGGRLDVAAGDATLKAGGSLASAGRIAETISNSNYTSSSIPNELRVQLSDGVATLEAAGTATLESIGALGVGDSLQSQGFYAAGSGVSILADGAVTVTNLNLEGVTPGPNVLSATVYPGSFEAVSFTAGLNMANLAGNPVLLYPDATGTLSLLVAGSIAPVTIAQLDSDPTLLPGAFSNSQGGLGFLFPTVEPDTTDVTLRLYHNPEATHAGDPTPDRIAAGVDINSLILSVDKQTRIAAGRDILNMVFLGQNLAASDVTRITAGRDITSTSVNEAPAANSGGVKLPTVQGDTFVLGGPGAFFLEAGRNAGPFLTSAISEPFTGVATPPQTYGGGVIAVGNEWNPYLPAQSADIYTEFGVANGQNYAGLISTYLNPANFGSQPGYLFLQTTASNGLQAPDPTKEDYSLSLVDWMTSIASSVIGRYETATGVKTPPANAPALIQFLETLQNGGTATTAQALTYLPQLADQTLPLIPWLQLNEPSVLTKAYGTLDVTYAQAFAAFQGLSTLTQREFLIKDVYFNELVQTSIPTSPSYLKYSRGYIAVNTLFPASDGYTANSLSGGPAGASTLVQTGNLDLRLATIQTDQGGNIAILGPGGRVLAGSVVSTSVQASKRYSAANQLYSGQPATVGQAISAIPSGLEGILTLHGGSIDSFTDQDFLLNQSRAFTEEGGDVAIWSSNADVNAGQGPRTTADVAPAVVHIDEDAFSTVDTDAAVTGAGIGAFNADASDLSPDVFLIAPRGTVDAGAAGIRSSGNVFIAAFQVANTAGIQASGTISGAGGPAAVNVSAQTSGNSASTAAAQAAQAASSAADQFERPIIVVDVLGYLPDEPNLCTPQELQDGKCK